MKVLCDVHISKKVVRFFQSQNIEALHVNDILQGSISEDQAIAALANFKSPAKHKGAAAYTLWKGIRKELKMNS